MIREKKGFWDRPWSVSQLHPDVQPLVARPLLVLPFSEFGKRARDGARKRSAIDNGSVSWISTPYGIGMRFPNPSVGSPTDFLSFPGATYPTASADMVPHSMAVLWMPTVSANTHYPFMTASSGNGVIVNGSSSGFSIVHGGVIGFTAIGASLYAVNNVYLQLYSYDQVTMNHMVLNLTTGKSASQAVAETGALTTSNGVRVGVKGASEALEGNVLGIAWVRGAWTLGEVGLLAAMPTAIWSPYPKRRRISFSAPAGAGSIGSGAGASQSDSSALGSGASIAAGAALSLAASLTFAVGVAISAGSGASSVSSGAAGSGAAIAAGAGASTSISKALGSNDNVVAAAGIAAGSSAATGAGGATASGDGRAAAVALGRATLAPIAAGVGSAFAIPSAVGTPAAIAAAIGRAASIARVIGDVSPPFDASTLVRAPHYMDFVRLEMRLESLALAQHMVFLSTDGDEEMFELRMVQGEVRDVEYFVRGAGSVPLDLTNSITRKLTVRVPGATPRVDQVDVTVVGAATDGRLKLAANAAIAGVAGRYKALTVITYPGGVIVKSPGEVLIDSAII